MSLAAIRRCFLKTNSSAGARFDPIVTSDEPWPRRALSEV